MCNAHISIDISSAEWLYHCNWIGCPPQAQGLALVSAQPLVVCYACSWVICGTIV